MERGINVFVGLALVGRANVGDDVRVDESAQLLVVDAEIVEQTLEERNHLDEALVSHQNQNANNRNASFAVHHFGMLIH